MPAYLIEGTLRRDATGIAYRGRHRVTRTAVLLKVLMAGQHATPEELRSLRGRVEAARVLAHAAIQHVLEAWEQGGSAADKSDLALWVAYEQVEGGNLAEGLARGPLPWKRAAEIAHEIADALDEAHRRQVVHLAVRPENLLLDPEGYPRLAEFGLGRATIPSPYAAPEQVGAEPGEPGPATDLWGLGATLHALVTGSPPFGFATRDALRDAMARGEPPRVTKVKPDVPGGLERVVRACLARAPSRRYVGAAELRDDLARVIAGQPPRHGQGTTRFLWPFGGGR